MNYKFVFVLVAAIVFAPLCFAKPIINVSGNAESYLNNSSQRRVKQLNLRTINASEKRISYEVAVDENSTRTYDSLKMRLSKEFDIYELKNKALKIKKNDVKLDLSNLGLRRELCARQMIEKIMPEEYSDKFMLISVDTEHSYSEKQGAKIEGYTFNFSRLFNGRVVRSRRDFLIIRTDANGFLKDARVSMRDFVKTTEIVDIEGNMNEYIATLDSLLIEEFGTVKVVDQYGVEKNESVDIVDIGSVAESYCEIIVGDSKMLFPCLSYASKIKLSNNEEFGYIIDAPYSRKSWSDYKNEKKGLAHFIRYSR